MRLLDPAAIEAEITASIDRSSDGVARASLFNLILLDHVGRPSPIALAVDTLLGKRPARILHVQSGYDGPTEAYVSVRCYPDRRNQGVCFQEVHILNGPDNRGLDPGSWSALVIREIPVFALIADPSLEPPAQIRALSEMIDKALFDTAAWGGGHPWEALAAMARFAAGGGLTQHRPALADFAWMRSLPLRRAIAHAFDSERALGMWDNIRALDIRGGARADAGLVALWLGARLGWTTGAGTAAEIGFEDRRSIAVRFTHAEAPGAGLQCTLTFDGGETIEIALGEDSARVRHIDGASVAIPLQPEDMGSLLMSEVDTLRADPLYYDALAGAGGLADP